MRTVPWPRCNGFKIVHQGIAGYKATYLIQSIIEDAANRGGFIAVVLCIIISWAAETTVHFTSVAHGT